jgi:signal transduction histidine kinase
MSTNSEVPMLYEFISLNRDTIVRHARDRVRSRPWPAVSGRELEHGVPLFLTQLAATLQLEGTSSPFASDAIGSAAARHGAELLVAGFNVAQVVHDYGDICQTVTELAVEQRAPISVEEFHTLNRCLDTAIAEAVTEHTRLTAQRRSVEEVERLGQVAHELRDLLNTALLAFHTLKRGTVGIGGSTGAVLGRSLTNLRGLVDRTLSEVRLAAGKQQRERITMTAFVDDIVAVGILHSEYRQIRFTVEPVDPNLVVDADPQLLTSAVMNLLLNAFKYTPPNGAVTLRARAQEQRLVIEIEDQCGGIPDSKGELFHRFGDRRGTDRSGLGLGLSIARDAVRAHQGDIYVRNMPGTGCVFSIDLPLVHDPESFSGPNGNPEVPPANAARTP